MQTLRSMSTFYFICGLVFLSLGLINNVKADCTNDNGSTCNGTDCCYSDIPPVLGSGGSIDPVQNCYPSGFRVTFPCPGDLKGPPYNDCNNGVWGFPFGPTCEAETACPDPTVPANGNISPNSSYNLYTRIYYSCDAGFSLVGPSEAVCESGGVWNPSTTPTCEADCTKPNLNNGEVDPDKDSFSNGEVLTYSCDTNYTLVGVSTTTCRDGNFDPLAIPTCYSMCNPPVVDNSDYSVQQPPVDHASTITVECDPGYSTGTGTDKDLTCNDGTFDDTPPVCYGNCLPLSNSFDNGVRSGDTTPFYHNEQVSYTCNNGFTLVGSSSITCNDGQWTDDEPVCKANCVVSAVPNSDYSSGDTVAHNTTFFISCNTGYSTGTAIATELSCNNGELSPDTLPICYENCPDVSDPENGQILSGDSPFFHLEEVTFECFDNFTLDGQSQITCSDGSYDNDPPVCSGKCKPPVIPNSNATSSSLLESGASITVTCNAGFSNGQSESSTSTCDSGVLYPAVPLCYADCKPPVVDDSDYDLQQNDVYHTTLITITCNSGYSTGTRLNTTLTCIDGQFSGTTPTCYADCKPPVVDDSDYDLQQNDVYHTTLITITCNSGYSTGTRLNTTLTCIDGQFSGTTPTCYADCRPQVVDYSDYQTQQPDVLHSTDLTISCWSNYSMGPYSQETTVSCDNGTLSEDSVVCYENCVVPVVEDSDYSQQKDDVFHMKTFNITCDDGYSNSEDIYTSLTCNDGKLDDVDPICYANCPDFGSIDDGSYTPGDASPFYHDETVTFSCDTNHTLVGEATLTCNDGNWSASIPSCEADCLPPMILNSDYNTSNTQVTHGTGLMITCDTGYSTGLNVTQYVTCNDGSFSPAPRDCLSDCIPPTVDNSDYATQQDPVFTSKSFVITCDANYTVGNGDSTASTTLTCTDGQLDQEDVTCYANCLDPGEPADGQYESDGFYHRSVVYYYCDQRFDLIGESELICNDGKWSSAAPNCTDKTSYDLIMLTCGPMSMEVQIPRILLEDITENDIGMEGDLTCNGYIDGDMMRVNTSLSACGTNKTENSTHDTYTNRVINNYYKDVITRVVDVQIPLQCAYERNQEVRAVRYAVTDYVLGKNLEETGVYKTTFGIYNTTCFKYRYNDGRAVDLDVNDELFFQLKLVTDVADNKLVAQECWATPSENGKDAISHDLVDDGCPSDDTLTFLTTNGEDTTVQFKLRSFRFVDDDDKEVYVHCEVFVCHEDSTDDFCEATCPSKRKRRRTDYQPSGWERAKLKGEMLNQTLLDAGEERTKRASGHHDPVVKFVKAGPFRWNIGEEPKGDAAAFAGDMSDIQSQNNNGHISDSSSSAWMHSVIGMGCIVVVFSVLLLVVVKHYKRRLKKDYRYHALRK